MDQQSVEYSLDSRGRFVVENYNWAKPFSNFLPGIGGDWGIPLWVFYVNRAQCLSSVGVRSKDGAILEFHSYNKAFQLTALQGFRTFLKLEGRGIYEPFQKLKDVRIKQKMTVSSEELEIHEVNPEAAIETGVRYFPVVGEPIPALVRELTVRNLRDRSVTVEVLDGAPRVLPYGMSQDIVKSIPRHIEGMMGVDQLEGVPVFRLKQTPEDVPEVGKLAGGHFYFSFVREVGYVLKECYIVDPDIIFGESSAFEYPWLFENEPMEDLLSAQQIRENKTPCAFTGITKNLPPDGELVLYSIIGGVPDDASLRSFIKAASREGFIQSKSQENRDTIDIIKNQAFTVSSSERFDQFCQQTFLDNVLRGGLPWPVETSEGKSVFFRYTRRHGDLERDYGSFDLEPGYLSQGVGYYRDVNQNHRNDVWFYPEVEHTDVVTFLNLLQTDGYNPQVVGRITYTAQDTPELREWLSGLVPDRRLRRELLEVVTRPFTPGEFVMKLESVTRRNPSTYGASLEGLMRFCRRNDLGDLHEGFWVDHWTYNLDLIDRFLEVYPEKLRGLLLERKEFTFYDNPDVVVPRDRKYVLVEGKVMQLDAVAHDQDKLRMINARPENGSKVHTQQGQGRVYRTNLLVKLLSVVANKVATLDPQGIGVMMEADKPGWCDPLNGLPGLLGSSICETLELERLCRFIRRSLDKLGLDDNQTVPVYEELHRFIDLLGKTMDTCLAYTSDDGAFAFWEESNRLKELYREETRMGVTGSERELTFRSIESFLDRALDLLGRATGPESEGKTGAQSGVGYTYFINDVTEHEPVWVDMKNGVPALGHAGHPLVAARRFTSRPLAHFLEGPVHRMRVHPESRGHIYKSVRSSRLYDSKLKMYKVCEDLSGEPIEIGRIHAYARGWIENESIYLHMEYKWLLELLRSGLYREFYQEIKALLIPFLDPRVYGRNILEASSYIVSSAFPDDKLHGRGFQPRLSGCVSEVLHMWTLMMAGEEPFSLDEEGGLVLRLRPALPGWMFTEEPKAARFRDSRGDWTTVDIPENAFGFRFIGKSLVVYHNPGRRDTFGESGAKVSSYRLEYQDGQSVAVDGQVIETQLALDVREGRVERIDAFLA